MPFTYDGSNLDVILNRIRFELGDTDSNRPLLQDEEIAFIVATYSALHIRVAIAARLIVAKFSGEADRVRIENFEEVKSNFVERYTELARLHEAKGFAPPYSSAQVKSDKEVDETNTSLVQPAFKRGMHDY